MNQIQRSFSEVIGRPGWGVKKGHGSFLTFEFGEPRLFVREPITSSAGQSSKLRRSLQKRYISVHGDWHLWIYCCDWKARANGELVGESTSSASRITKVAESLDGQVLVDVRLHERGARTTFEFDLGGVLETRPFDRTGEQWLLYERSGNVLTLRADRRYQYGPSNKIGGKWRAA